MVFIPGILGSNPYIFPSFPSGFVSHSFLPQLLDLRTWCEVCASIYIAYISVSKSTPLAVTGPHGQLASKLLGGGLKHFPTYDSRHIMTHVDAATFSFWNLIRFGGSCISHTDKKRMTTQPYAMEGVNSELAIHFSMIALSHGSV